VGRDEQRAKDVVAEIEDSGGTAHFRLTTLADLQSAQDLVEWATEAGEGHADILINNAGVALMGPSNAATKRVRRHVCSERQGSVLPRRGTGASDGRTRMGFDCQELAAAVVFLGSDEASFVHGVTLAVDGGRVAT
jgi:NAD(P)-dependent dehydrogenase (short-subunit alcohol dehydrogenase family)